jgi:hypothetical protein
LVQRTCCSAAAVALAWAIRSGNVIAILEYGSHLYNRVKVDTIVGVLTPTYFHSEPHGLMDPTPKRTFQVSASATATTVLGGSLLHRSVKTTWSCTQILPPSLMPGGLNR